MDTVKRSLPYYRHPITDFGYGNHKPSVSIRRKSFLTHIIHLLFLFSCISILLLWTIASAAIRHNRTDLGVLRNNPVMSHTKGNQLIISGLEIPHEGTRTETTIGEYFDGEEFTYNIAFWWFTKAATATIGIHKQEDGVYHITLAAETMGFIGFITSYRKDIYHAYVEETDGGKRFRTVRFEKAVVIGKKKRNGYTVVDYNQGIYRWRNWDNGNEGREIEEPIPAGGFCDDPLTGFYNFRFGVYGPIEEGKEYHVPTFPKNGISTIYVRIATNGERMTRLNPDLNPVNYLADIVIDKELFGSQTGRVEVHFTKELIPVVAIAKDLIWFGDVRGTLVEATSRMGFTLQEVK